MYQFQLQCMYDGTVSAIYSGKQSEARMFIIIRYDGVDGGTKDATIYDKRMGDTTGKTKRNS